MPRTVYIKEKIELQPGETQDYIFDDRVNAGRVLEVHNLCAWFSGIKSTEEVLFFAEDMGRKCYLGDDLPVVTDGRAHWNGKVFIGEGDRVGAYIPDIDAAETAYLWVFGVLWDREDWIKASTQE